jgi:membrane protease YdiL (CAAX protease family)
LLIVPPTILQWFLDDQESIDFSLRVAATITGNLALLALVLYLNWRSGEPWRRLGWSARNWIGEALVGILLFLPFATIATGIGQLLVYLGLPGEDLALLVPSVTGTLQTVLAGLALVIVAVSEEAVFRGYLLLRITEWRHGGATFAVIASSTIFALGHEYQGLAGMITVGSMGLMFAGVYLWRKSLVAPIVIHFLQNALAVAAIQHG